MSSQATVNHVRELSYEPENRNALPRGWTTASLRLLVDVLDNQRIPINSSERAKRLGNVPYFGATGQVGWIDDFLFDEEILLIGEDGAPFFDKSKPIAYIVSGKSWVNNHAHALRANCEVTSNRYLKYYLDWFDFNGYVNGTTRLKLTQAAMNSIPVRVPPLGEQRRIVEKLDLLLGKVSSSQQRLSRIPGLLKRFRQSVLAAACSGKLTADWREVNPCDSEYCSTVLEEVAEYIGGFAYRSPTFLPAGQHQVIRIGNVRPIDLDLSVSPVFIPNEIAAETERFALRPGDIVISMTGTRYKRDYGYASRVTDSHGSLFLNQRVSRVRCGSKILSSFLLYWMHSDLFRNHFFEGETGNVNQGNVGADGIRKAPIQLPPLAEQQEIVERVEKLLAFADQIEARLKQAQAHVDRLTQSILAKAFRGELVPTEHALAEQEGREYEPASMLLERLRQKAATDAPAPRKKKAKT